MSAPDPSPEQTAETTTARAVRLLALLITLGGLFPVPFLLTARWHWLSELFTHFRVQYAVALLVALPIVAALRRWRELVVLTALFVWTLAGIVPLYLGTPAPGPHDARVLLTNVLVDNPHKQEVIALINRERPDVIVALEVNRAWYHALQAALAKTYPHKRALVREDAMGMVLFSRHPFASEPRWIEETPGAPPILRAPIQLPDARRLVVYGAHPPPPVGRWHAMRRNTYIKLLATHAREERDPVVVVGDFNSSMWSPVMADLLREAHLTDARDWGFGLATSWPSTPDNLAEHILPITIDHALVSSGVRPTDRRLGPDVGSDHRPVILDVRLPTP